MNIPRAVVGLSVALAATMLVARPGAADEELSFEGRAVQGGLVVGQLAPGSRATLDGRRLHVTSDGVVLIGFAMDSRPRRVLVVTTPDGVVSRKTFEVDTRNFATERIDGLPDDEVNPDRATRAQIRRAHRELQAKRRTFRHEPSFVAALSWPAEGRITSRYGVRRVLNGENRDPHAGVDIAVPQGTPIRAPAAGVVAFVDPDLPLSGGTILLDHGEGLTSTFLHLSAIDVHPGDRVHKGAILGRSGSTGRATGAHVEWQVHLDGVALDPELIVDLELPRAAATAGHRYAGEI